MLIGITGKQGSGKSTYAKKLSEDLGYLYVPLDKIAHEVIEEHKKEIGCTFGTYDRKEIGKIIFSNREKYRIYNHMIQVYLEQKVNKLLEEYENVILDSALLPEMIYFIYCDKKILVKANFFTRMFRVLKRDKITLRYFLAREKHSLKYNILEFDEVITT